MKQSRKIGLEDARQQILELQFSPLLPSVRAVASIGDFALQSQTTGGTSLTSPRLPTKAISMPAKAQRGANHSARRKVPSVKGATATCRPCDGVAINMPTVSHNPL